MSVTQAGSLTDFRVKYRIADLAILSRAHWTWSLRPHQPTLGSGILSLNRPASSLGHLTQEEASELAELAADLEATLKHAFDFERINYMMMMMFDTHLHFHVFPRYGSARIFDGRKWIDANWPRPVALSGSAPSDQRLRSLREHILAHV